MSRRLDARRRKLQNHDFSILCNRCIGGVVSHAVGEQFRSPTVNLIDGVPYRKAQKGPQEYQWMDEFYFVAWLNDGTIRKNELFA